VALAQPGDLGVVAVAERLGRRHGEVGDAGDLHRRTVGEAALGADRHLVGADHRAAVAADHERPEQRLRLGIAVQHLPVAAGAAQRVIEAVQRGGADGRCGDQCDGDRR
jgi:hypothetical protein